MSALTGRTPRDANRVPATFGVSSVDGRTVTPLEVNPTSGRLLVDVASSDTTSSAVLNSIDTGLAFPLQQYLSTLATPLQLQLAYSDDFGQGFQGWEYQYDTSSNPKKAPTLTEEARTGNWGLELHTSAVNNAQSWARKGYRLPNVSKMIFGCYFTIHSEDKNSPQSVAFECDTQIGDGTGTGTQRWYFSARYLNYLTSAGGLVQKWQVNTGTPTAQVYTDVTNGGMVIPFNEASKPMPSYVMVVYDFTNKQYEKIYSNGYVFDCTGLAPTAGASLGNPFDWGMVNIVQIDNRTDSPKEGNMIMEQPFLVWGY